MESNFVTVVLLLMLPLLPSLFSLSLPYSKDANVEIDPDIMNSIFGSSLDSARYGAAEEEWEEVEITLLPDDSKDCKPLQHPSPEPAMTSLHEEYRQVEVLKAETGKKCDHYTATQGFECVPYYQCGADGQIITDGYGLIDIRFGGEDKGPELAVLDSTDLMCKGSLDVCCKNPDFVAPTRAPLKSTTATPDTGYADKQEEDSSEEDTGTGKSTDGGYGGDGKDSGDDGGHKGEGKDSGDDGGYGGDGKDSGDTSDEDDSKESSEGGDDNSGYGGNKVPDGKSEKLTYEERCGRRNKFGLGVRIQNYKDGEGQFGEWPHQCAILRKEIVTGGYGQTEEVKVFVGGASLLYPGVVLTAAHKVQKYLSDPGQLIVRCGEWDTQTESEPLPHQDIQIKEIVIHPGFNKKTLAYTAAVIILQSEFELDKHIDVVCLPQLSEVFTEETECFVKGWGKDKWEDGEYQVVMKQISVPMVPRDQCLTWLQATRLGRYFRLDSSFACAGGEEGADACKGDGGGPLVCPTKADPSRYVQVGIVAWGIGCGQQNVPGVYTSVAHISCWIDYVIHCKLGNKYPLRLGKECESQTADPFLTKTLASDSCKVSWPVRNVGSGKSVDPYAPVQSLPEKISAAPGY